MSCARYTQSRSFAELVSQLQEENLATWCHFIGGRGGGDQWGGDHGTCLKVRSQLFMSSWRLRTVTVLWGISRWMWSSPSMGWRRCWSTWCSLAISCQILRLGASQWKVLGDLLQLEVGLFQWKVPGSTFRAQALNGRSSGVFLGRQGNQDSWEGTGDSTNSLEIAYQTAVIKLGWNLARKKCPKGGRVTRPMVDGCCVNNHPKNIYIT